MDGPENRRDLAVIGASAGGIEALQNVLGGLSPDHAGAVLVVMHLSAIGSGALPRILGRSTGLPVAYAIDGEPLRRGRVYLASNDHHLLVADGHLMVRRGPRENGYRPAIDPFFRSAVHSFGPRTVGVVLSGTLHDGTAGLVAIRRHGGAAIVQDPADAAFDGMPTRALALAGADRVGPAAAIGAWISEWAAPPEGRPDTDTLEMEGDPASESGGLDRMEVAIMAGRTPPEPEAYARPSPWPCPDCDGVLWEVEDDPRRFRRVGHAWSEPSLLQAQESDVETALWVALRTIDDRLALVRSMAERAEAAGRPHATARLRDTADDLEQNAATLRRLLLPEPTSAAAPPPPSPVTDHPDERPS